MAAVEPATFDGRSIMLQQSSGDGAPLIALRGPSLGSFAHTSKSIFIAQKRSELVFPERALNRTDHSNILRRHIPREIHRGRYQSRRSGGEGLEHGHAEILMFAG